MTTLLEKVDNTRIEANQLLNSKKRSELGQFMTPMSVAKYMASLFREKHLKAHYILDAGAGVGSLTCAYLERLINNNLAQSANVVAFEIDSILRGHLTNSIQMFSEKLNLSSQIMSDDFIEWAVQTLLDNKTLLDQNNQLRVTHAILNPPYKQIASDSRHRKLLRSVGIETGNLYSAFIALSLALMEEGGQIVAIIPRSFCNGPYFRRFRQYLLEKAAIHHLHLFESRDKAFKDNEVLQENVIIMLERGGIQGDVTVSTSTDGSFNDYVTKTRPFERIVSSTDTEKFIHIPTSSVENPIVESDKIIYSLQDIGVQVSTGPVVDFRTRGSLRAMPEENTVPLFYPNHFVGQYTEWPKEMKNPNAIIRDDTTEKSMYPNGYYTVVKRFSSKEEKKRVVAGVLDPEKFDTDVVAFENSLNVLHSNKQGIPRELAYGLFVYLNSTLVDQYFRIFNGHTQVNATDLRTMKFPSKQVLMELGSWTLTNSGKIEQEQIDKKVEEIL
ncbi:Eco57I restriction-modification methylase domain-containing protein [Paenibacillus rigui]|uniref:site-specific DNA-methyltransferase (adenine-specific) n=1 Tax=Paenibacillus rigui TaxID=554312 RepID=A0A229UJX2_9BACL|nr:Eco57I restriction-modification methylase domain-containing protein [Paenibacillus rigui]OXM83693.1 SAM-dependent methyltransferase [Paenibacillus rigui]